MASTCKRCGAPLVWKVTPKRKFIPCDEGLIEYQADETSNDILINDKGEVIHCKLKFTGRPDGLARKPHWATCPYANEFKGDK